MRVGPCLLCGPAAPGPTQGRLTSYISKWPPLAPATDALDNRISHWIIRRHDRRNTYAVSSPVPFIFPDVTKVVGGVGIGLMGGWETLQKCNIVFCFYNRCVNTLNKLLISYLHHYDDSLLDNID